jgi:uncharacterized protein (TIGR02268 family)
MKVDSRDHTEPAASTPTPGHFQRVLRSSSRVAVEVTVVPPKDAPRWEAEGATLVDAQGHELKVLPLWQGTPSETEPWTRVVVEAEATSQQAEGRYTLKLWAQGGTRSITLEGVSFPPLPSAPAR